jgi:hypothetical protein
VLSGPKPIGPVLGLGLSGEADKSICHRPEAKPAASAALKKQKPAVGCFCVCVCDLIRCGLRAAGAGSWQGDATDAPPGAIISDGLGFWLLVVVALGVSRLAHIVCGSSHSRPTHTPGGGIVLFERPPLVSLQPPPHHPLPQLHRNSIAATDGPRWIVARKSHRTQLICICSCRL